jgi:hypothetical protein
MVVLLLVGVPIILGVIGSVIACIVGVIAEVRRR